MAGHWSGKTRAFRWQPKHETFCHGIVAGLTHRDAYIGAGYRRGAADGVGPDSLLKRPEIQDRIAELQALQRIRLNITMDGIIAELEEERAAAMRLGHISAAVLATMSKAKLVGLLPSDKPDVNLNVISVPANRPMERLEYTVEEWIEEFSPKQVSNGGNGHGD